jgi:hypothetical protein
MKLSELIAHLQIIASNHAGELTVQYNMSETTEADMWTEVSGVGLIDEEDGSVTVRIL